MTKHEQVIERIAAVEVLVAERGKDIIEIKKDVKLLLESKWRRDGKTAIIAATVAALTTFISFGLDDVTRIFSRLGGH